MLQVTSFKELLQVAGSRFGHRPFLINDHSLGTVSYEDLLLFASGLEEQFEELEVPVGASVATSLNNGGIAAALFLAVMASGRVLVPLNPAATSEERQYMLDRAGCVAIITTTAEAKTSSYGNRWQIPVWNDTEYFRKRCAEGSHAGGLKSDGKQARFCGEVVYTSGSTGYPKGVELSERSLLEDAAALAEVYKLNGNDRFLTVCPLFHNSGQVFTTLSCVLVGGSTAAIKSDVGLLHFWRYVDEYRANWSLGMVSFLALLLSQKESPSDPKDMRGILVGGSAIDAGIIQRFEKRFGVPVRTCYGLTETASISTCEYLDPTPRSLGSSGRPLPICRVSIATQAETRASSESNGRHRGEILISGTNLFDRYIGDPDLTESRKRDGCLHTGDIGYFDENGNLFVVDRADAMVIVGGENVYPAEVEKLCTSLPGAAQIVLTAVDHAIWGKELVLVYKPESGAALSIHLWHRVLAEKLAVFKIPQRYFAIHDLGREDFPRKENGKLDRQAIATLVMEKLESGAGASV